MVPSTHTIVCFTENSFYILFDYYINLYTVKKKKKLHFFKLKVEK